ncbi:hypothetical protein CIHG_04084 [Coccidioides immitis H538.4]|uniref:Uncharacterized protein n=1 Tax=Coccidioides immitis H538.4 TaxID=396776 RepID=A0A0J8RNY7_COCIT|nr:hypothetical protein CIHG_04084 [Coccidioides immitis H538.4]
MFAESRGLGGIHAAVQVIQGLQIERTVWQPAASSWRALWGGKKKYYRIKEHFMENCRRKLSINIKAAKSALPGTNQQHKNRPNIRPCAERVVNGSQGKFDDLQLSTGLFIVMQTPKKTRQPTACAELLSGGRASERAISRRKTKYVTVQDLCA